MSIIIECPACSTRYKMNKPIPVGGRSVKCARCGHQWRMLPDQDEAMEEIEVVEVVEAASQPAEPQPVYHPAPASAESEPGYEHAAPAAEPIGSSWEVRRGNLAAALASMSESVEAMEDGRHAQRQKHDEVQHSAAEETAYQASRNQETEAAANSFGYAEPNGIAGRTTPSAYSASDPYDDNSGRGQSENPWKAAVGRPSDRDLDPELSIRQVLRAALDEPQAGAEERNQAAFKAAASAMSRPVFTGAEGADAEPTRQGVDNAWATPPYASSAAAADSRGDAFQYASAERWQRFAAAERATLSEPDDPEPLAEGELDTEAFENDIAGVFRKQMQAKRSFGHNPQHANTASIGFDPYDLEEGQAPSASAEDDRYMADSSLDADAAALEAALKGSLRVIPKKRNVTRPGPSGVGLALAAAWAVFLCVLTGVTLAFVNFRDDIVVALPGMGALYRGIGLGAQDQQIDFGKVSYRWTVADGKPMIEVTGQVINLTDHEITVPRVLVNVRDKESADPVKATATLRSDPLAPRETADFTLEFIAPSKSVSQIELAFAEGAN